MKLKFWFFISILLISQFSKSKHNYLMPKAINFEECAQDSSIIYLFVHGLGATGKQAKRYQALMYHGASVYFDFPDAKEKPNDYHRSLANLGQEGDIACLKYVCDIIEKEHPNSLIILIGVSRGAVAIINFMAYFKPAKVKMVIIESPFDTYISIINHLIKQYLSWLKWFPGLKDFGKELFKKKFPAFKPHGILPIDQISNIPNIPILFIHSCNDELIPVKSSENLWKKINQRGNAYLVTLKKARHAHLITHKECKIDYENAVHAFYKKYGLPCDEQKAEIGKILI